jgi:PAS domain S-box-containing protein/diguanylate cyclase (GGDEF)-like protein
MVKRYLNVYVMLTFTLVAPIFIGFYLLGFSGWSYVSMPLHSTLESIGGAMALIIASIIFMLHFKHQEFNHFHMASFALISMGIFDIFHAVVNLGELFVWLHSLAIFFGGFIFALVWMPNISVSRKGYYLTPSIFALFAIGISVVSMMYPSIVPQMLDHEKHFTVNANLLNLIGGSMFIVASVFFIKQYLEDKDMDNLLFAGHTMLFGSAGVLFFFSSLWDMNWWFWHTLRLFAYIVSLYFMLKVFYNMLKKVELANNELRHANQQLSKSIELLQEYKKAIDEGSVVSVGDLNGNIVSVNDEFLKLTGYSKEELIGKPHNILRDPSTPKTTFKEMWETIQNKKIFKGILKNRKKNGESFYVKITIVPILDNKGEIFEYLAFRDDVSELVSAQKEYAQMFYTDALTKLHNRFKLQEDLKKETLFHLALLNIDNFKSINDYYGEELGDKTLVVFANKLVDFGFEHGYQLYRTHGDEFALIVESGYDSSLFIKNLQAFSKRQHNTSLHVQTKEINIGITIGVSPSNNDFTTVDIALKEAKNTKKSLVVYRENSATSELFKKNIEWSQRIKDALKEDRVDVVLQAIQTNGIEKIQKYEALVRIIEKDGTIISPFEFLDISKSLKLYGQISRRMMQKVFVLFNKIEENISINIDVDDIFDDETMEYFFNMLSKSKNADRLTVELVESESIESFEQVKFFLNKIKNHRVKLAIDDFGTGYSNFEYLLKLKADFIKIDGSLIKNIDTDPNVYSVVETIVAFAKKNSMGVVAEFVSSKEIQEKILELGIEYSQGYFIQKPLFLSQLGGES